MCTFHTTAQGTILAPKTSVISDLDSGSPPLCQLSMPFCLQISWKFFKLLGICGVRYYPKIPMLTGNTWISLTYNLLRKETSSPPSKVRSTAMSMLTTGELIHWPWTTSTFHGWHNLNRPPKYPPLRHTTCTSFWSMKLPHLWRQVPFVTSLPFLLHGAIVRE